MRRLDYTVCGALALVLVLTPLAIGAVHPLAYSIAEAVLFLLATLWAAGVLLARDREQSDAAPAWAGFRHFAPPLGLFIAFLLFQLVPLPSTLLRTLSPATYRLYAMSLPGWPAAAPYQNLRSGALRVVAGEPDEAAVLPTMDEVRNHGVAIPFAPPALGVAETARENPAPRADRRPSFLGRMLARGWGTIAVAPPLTGAGLLGMLAVTTAFLLAAFYPFGSGASLRDDRGFIRSIALTIIAIGTVVALSGIIERVYWNGRVLWFFVPSDWGKPMLDFGGRARGPFVDPDHFAGYLAMIFPLALSGTLFPSLLTPRNASREFQIACGFSSFVIFAAVLLSASRAGWIGLALGACLVSALVLGNADDYAVLGIHASRSRSIGIGLGVAAALVALTLLFVGASGRADTQLRLRETLEGGGSGGWDRGQAWRAGLVLVRDFPLFGVGLGNWPEVFTRYQPPPWVEVYFSQAHNDFLQLLAETGLVGALLLGFFFIRAGRSLARSDAWSAPEVLPLLAALVSGLAVMGVCEIFDFDLRVPANALLFAVLLGLAVRLTLPEARNPRETPRRGHLLPLAAGAFAVVLMLLALDQDYSIYPYNLAVATTPDAARAMLLSYPANAYAHYVTLHRFGRAMRSEDRLRELKTIVYLDPTSPRAHDLYAQELERAGRLNDAFEQIRLSVAASPEPGLHGYLSARVTPWLSGGEQLAIERGYQDALAKGYRGALDGLGAYYADIGRFTDEAKLYEDAAGRAESPADQANESVAAGNAYVQIGDVQRATDAYRKAAAAEPEDIKPYEALIALLLKQPGGGSAARAVADQGIDNGVDPAEMLDALGTAAYLSDHLDVAESALRRSLEYRPSSFNTTLLLGTIYNGQQRYDRAAITLQHALELESDSAQANWELGKAKEGSYDYFEAEQAYRRAIALRPDDAAMRSYFADFQHRMTAGQKAIDHSQP